MTLRMIAAYGIPGYGPDASDGNFSVMDTWPDVADELVRMLQESADSAGDDAAASAENGDYETAWKTRTHADEMYNLAAQLNNERQHAPLYEGKPELWAQTIERIVAENFPYDVDASTRLYCWQSDDFGTDEG